MHKENGDELFSPLRPNYDPKVHLDRSELARKIDQAINIIEVEKLLMKNTEIENLDDYKTKISERKQRFEVLRKKRNDVMQVKIDEHYGIKASKNIEFAKIISNDTSDSNLDKIEQEMRSIS